MAEKASKDNYLYRAVYSRTTFLTRKRENPLFVSPGCLLVFVACRSSRSNVDGRNEISYADHIVGFNAKLNRLGSIITHLDMMEYPRSSPHGITQSTLVLGQLKVGPGLVLVEKLHELVVQLLTEVFSLLLHVLHVRRDLLRIFDLPEGLALRSLMQQVGLLAVMFEDLVVFVLLSITQVKLPGQRVDPEIVGSIGSLEHLTPLCLPPALEILLKLAIVLDNSRDVLPDILLAAFQFEEGGQALPGGSRGIGRSVPGRYSPIPSSHGRIIPSRDNRRRGRRLQSRKLLYSHSQAVEASLDAIESSGKIQCCGFV